MQPICHNGGCFVNTKLRNARRRKGWTLDVASSKIGNGIHPNTLSAWEKGRHKPGIGFLADLQRVYEASLYDLGLEHVVDSDSTSERLPEIASIEVQSPFVGDILNAEDLEIRLLVQVYRWNRRSADYGNLQRSIQQEIRSYDDMTDSETNKLENPERRKALRVLAKLPIQLYGLTALGASSAIAAEELLPHCAAGLTACWHLSNGIDLQLAQTTLSAYLPTLQKVATQSTVHKKVAAGLVAQAYLLHSVLAWHLESLERAEWYARQAISFSNLAEDAGLQAASHKKLATVYYYSNRPQKSLVACQQATLYLKNAPIAVQSFVYRELSSYQAIDGQIHDALVSLDRAHKAFAHPSMKDGPSYAAGDEFEMILWDGLTHYHLGQYKESLNSFLEIDGLQPKKPIAERIRIEFLNNQALIELRRKERDMELAMAYWKAGIQGAVALKSERRYSEAYEVYRTMQAVWPEEKSIAELRPLLKRWDD